MFAWTVSFSHSWPGQNRKRKWNGPVCVLCLSLTWEHNDSFVTKLPSTDPWAAVSMQTRKGSNQLEEKRYNGIQAFVSVLRIVLLHQWLFLSSSTVCAHKGMSRWPLSHSVYIHLFHSLTVFYISYKLQNLLNILLLLTDFFKQDFGNLASIVDQWRPSPTPKLYMHIHTYPGSLFNLMLTQPLGKWGLSQGCVVLMKHVLSGTRDSSW